MKPSGRASAGRGRACDQDFDKAEAVAIEALSFLAGEPERINRFLTLSGLTAQTLRAAADTPGFLAAVIDHVTNDASLLLTFAAHTGRDPREIDRAYAVLLGPNHHPGP